MAKTNRYTIDFQTIANGVSELRFDVSEELFKLYEDSEIENGSGEIVIVVNKNDNTATLDTNIDAVVQIICDRCLDIMDVKIDNQYQCVVKVSEQSGEYDGDILWLNPRDQKLDLSQYLYENIVLSLPIARTHNDVSLCNQEVVKFIKGVE